MVMYLSVSCRPFTGAWIETLKEEHPDMYREVAPSQGRGLKHIKQIKDTIIRSRPFTGAWIETTYDNPSDAYTDCRPFTGAWIETMNSRS